MKNVLVTGEPVSSEVKSVMPSTKKTMWCRLCLVTLHAPKLNYNPSKKSTLGIPKLNNSLQKPHLMCNAVIHLAGETIAGRWNAEKETPDTRQSRPLNTQPCCIVYFDTDTKPEVLVCASAIGLYGDSGDECFYRGTTPPGTDFLAEVCHEWEDRITESE